MEEPLYNDGAYVFHRNPAKPPLHSQAERLYNDGAYVFHRNGALGLTVRGWNIFEELLSRHRHERRFTDLLKTAGLVRAVYDKLTKDELSLLMYKTYPEYVDDPDACENLIKRGVKIADSLLARGMITEERRDELADQVKPACM